MKFNPRARLNTSQVRRRGPSGGAGAGGLGGGLGGGFGRGGGGMGGLALPGGIGGLLIVGIIFVVMQLAGGGGSVGAGYDEGQLADADLSQCQTGADATEFQDCRILATVNSVQAFWAEALPD
ncbi:MAG: peptidase, partial [Nocardioidaceae bacterium]|nr:peptidase [Nocardioidaceae bacterium]